MKQTILINITENKEKNEERKLEDLHGLLNLLSDISECCKCPYSETRKNLVVGEGMAHTGIYCVGEVPGPDEDKVGLPFVGRAGKLLRKMLVSCGLDLEKDIYITNIVRCKPSKGLNPDALAVKSCSPWLQRQIEIVNPRIILSVGRFSSAFFLNGKPDKIGITKISGKKFEKNGRLIFPIVHPSYILRNHIDHEKYFEHFFEFMGVL